MQLLPMYLALFFGTLLATTTDAAPRGFKKDDDVHSLGRIRMLKTGKHAAITTTAENVKNGGSEEPVPTKPISKGGSHKTGGSDKTGGSEEPVSTDQISKGGGDKTGPLDKFGA
jgi:hypothetical protein